MSIHPTIIKNIKQMCLDRGYTILYEKEDEIITDRCYIIFTKDIKIGIGYIKDISHMMEEQRIDHVILIYNKHITVNAQSLNDIKHGYAIEFFNEKSFMYNIVHHELVPQHSKVLKNTSEYKSIYKDKTNLPHIHVSDPVCKYYNFKSGDIIKIKRKNNIIVYRLVV